MAGNFDGCSHELWDLWDSSPDALLVKCHRCGKTRLVYLDGNDELVMDDELAMDDELVMYDMDR